LTLLKHVIEYRKRNREEMGDSMAFIDAFWWVWGVGMVVTVLLLCRRVLHPVGQPFAIFEQRTHLLVIDLLPAWTFRILFTVAVVHQCIACVKA
jgi:hypothetical protein